MLGGFNMHHVPPVGEISGGMNLDAMAGLGLGKGSAAAELGQDGWKTWR